MLLVKSTASVVVHFVCHCMTFRLTHLFHSWCVVRRVYNVLLRVLRDVRSLDSVAVSARDEPACLTAARTEPARPDSLRVPTPSVPGVDLASPAIPRKVGC